MHRILSRVCMINSTRFRDHDIDENAQRRIGIAVDRMGDLHLVMDDTPGISAEDVEGEACFKQAGRNVYRLPGIDAWRRYW